MYPSHARRLIVSAMTDCITTMEEPKWDEMASLYVFNYLKERGVVFSVKEDHTLEHQLGDPSTQPGQETETSSVGRHGRLEPEHQDGHRTSHPAEGQRSTESEGGK